MENVKPNLGDVSEEEFLYALINKDTPEMELKKFVSTVLDITIIKPLIETFLDIETSSGREIYLSHDPERNWGSSFYTREINYLKENGYVFIKEGEIWHAVR